MFVLCIKSNRSPQIRNVFNQNLFYFPSYMFQYLLDESVSHVNTLSFSSCLLKSQSTSLVFVISLSQSCLHFLWSTSFVFVNFHIPTPLVLLLVPQPNTEQLSPGMTIVNQLTGNLTAKSRTFDSNFDFFETPDAILTVLSCTVAITSPS